jgi:hypothetical protein
MSEGGNLDQDDVQQVEIEDILNYMQSENQKLMKVIALKSYMSEVYWNQ